MIMNKIGNRYEVMNRIAKQTGGGLKKKDLKYNKFGKIVSKKMSNIAKKNNRLQNAGYYNIKGQFGSFKIDGGASKESSKKDTNGKEILSSKSVNEYLSSNDNNSLKNSDYWDNQVANELERQLEYPVNQPTNILENKDLDEIEKKRYELIKDYLILNISPQRKKDILEKYSLNKQEIKKILKKIMENKELDGK